MVELLLCLGRRWPRFVEHELRPGPGRAGVPTGDCRASRPLPHRVSLLTAAGAQPLAGSVPSALGGSAPMFESFGQGDLGTERK